jgi:hypothetical protein
MSNMDFDALKADLYTAVLIANTAFYKAAPLRRHR